MKTTTFLKIFASYLILIVLAIGAMDFFLTPKIKDTMTRIIEDDMFGNARIIMLMPRDTLKQNVPEIAKQLNVRVTIIDSAGQVISDSQVDAKKMDNHLNRPEIQQAKTDGRGKASRFSVTLQESLLYVALPIKENSETVGYIRLARPLVEITKSLDDLYKALYLTLYIIALPSLLLALIFSRKIASQLSI